MTDASHEIGREADARPALSGQSCSSRNSPAVSGSQQRAAVSAAGAFSRTRINDSRRWTPEQLEQLEAMLHTPMTMGDYEAFGAPMGRSGRSVERRLFQMRKERGIIAPPRVPRTPKRPRPLAKNPRGRGKPFSDAEDLEIWRLRHEEGLGQKEIGRRLGRSNSVISERLIRLAVTGLPVPSRPMTRKCLTCRTQFTFNRAVENFYLCEAHRAGFDPLPTQGFAGSIRTVR